MNNIFASKEKPKVCPILIRFVLVILILYYLFSKGIINFNLFLNLKMNPYFFGFLLIPLSELILSIRWVTLLKAQGVQINLLKAIQLNLTGAFFSLFIPGTYSGDFIKIYYATRYSKGIRTNIALSILLDRFIGLQTLLILASTGAGIYLYRFNQKITQQMAIFFLIIISCSFISVLAILHILFKDFKTSYIFKFFTLRLGKKVNEILIKIADSFSLYRNNLSKVWLSYIFSFMLQLCLIGCYCFIEKILRFSMKSQGLPDPGVNFILHLILDPLCIIASAVPISPLSIGVRETVFEFFYSSMNNMLGAEIGLFISMTASIWFGFMGGISFLLIKRSITKI